MVVNRVKSGVTARFVAIVVREVCHWIRPRTHPDQAPRNSHRRSDRRAFVDGRPGEALSLVQVEPARPEPRDRFAVRHDRGAFAAFRLRRGARQGLRRQVRKRQCRRHPADLNAGHVSYQFRLTRRLAQLEESP
jgi:hypothetical protein